jgi:hypothetical protein
VAYPAGAGMFFLPPRADGSGSTSQPPWTLVKPSTCLPSIAEVKKTWTSVSTSAYFSSWVRSRVSTGQASNVSETG